MIDRVVDLWGIRGVAAEDANADVLSRSQEGAERMKELLHTIVAGLVENPDAIEITEDEPAEDGTLTFHLHVAPEDTGRVIGKQGRIAKAIRVIMSASSTKNNHRVSVEIE